MRANESELHNFFWHCLVAARLSTEFRSVTVTRSHILRAVRMATDCYIGKHGVEYASDAARAHKESLGLNWDQCGLIKEHVIPVRIVRSIVREQLADTITNGAVLAVPMHSDQDVQGLPSEVVDLFREYPQAWSVARVVREWALHAWITPNEDGRFDDKNRHDGISIRSCMPKGWYRGQDRFARYRNCEINVSRIL